MNIFELILIANDIEVKIFINMCLAIDQSLVVFWKIFLSHQSFWVKKCKINVYEEKGVLSDILIKLMCMR